MGIQQPSKTIEEQPMTSAYFRKRFDAMEEKFNEELRSIRAAIRDVRDEMKDLDGRRCEQLRTRFANLEERIKGVS